MGFSKSSYLQAVSRTQHTQIFWDLLSIYHLSCSIEICWRKRMSWGKFFRGWPKTDFSCLAA